MRSSRYFWDCIALELGITYLVEGMLDNHLAVGVRYAGKQIPYGCVRLLVDVLLLLWDGFGLPRLCADALQLVAEGRACLFND